MLTIILRFVSCC